MCLIDALNGTTIGIFDLVKGKIHVFFGHKVH